eukprot:scaffold9442_cov117-Isochrysis_galbana.AAC.1
MHRRSCAGGAGARGPHQPLAACFNFFCRISLRFISSKFSAYSALAPSALDFCTEAIAPRLASAASTASDTASTSAASVFSPALYCLMWRAPTGAALTGSSLGSNGSSFFSLPIRFCGETVASNCTPMQKR